VTNKNKYGALYNGYTVNTNKYALQAGMYLQMLNGQTLTTYLKGDSVAGGKLKKQEQSTGKAQIRGDQ